MSLERLGEQHVPVVDKFHDLVDVDYTMNVRDYVVRASAVTAAITITLPPVVEAKGRFYSIFVVAATGTFTVTLDENNNDSERWFLTGIPFNERGQGCVCYSDGRRWNVMPQGVIGAQFSSARVDAVATVHAGIIQLISEVASAVTQSEALRVTAASEVQTGNWYNAITGVIDYGDAGYVTGLAGVICAELNMPAGAVPGGSGTYWAFEAEINLPTSYVGGGVPVAILGANIWGGTVAQFDDFGLLFDINGVTIATTHFMQVNTAGAATHALKCRVNGTLYYVMLTDTGA